MRSAQSDVGQQRASGQRRAYARTPVHTFGIHAACSPSSPRARALLRSAHSGGRHGHTRSTRAAKGGGARDERISPTEPHARGATGRCDERGRDEFHDSKATTTRRRKGRGDRRTIWTHDARALLPSARESRRRPKHRTTTLKRLHNYTTHPCQDTNTTTRPPVPAR